MNVPDFLNVSYVIVGGVATQLYMPQRQTRDINILVLTQHVEALETHLVQSGAMLIEPLNVVNNYLHLQGSAWTLPLEQNREVELDVIHSAELWAALAIESPQYPENQPEIPVIALPYLTLMKLTSGRTQDFADVSRMLGHQSETILESVKQTVQRYAPSTIEDLEALITIGQLEYERSPQMQGDAWSFGAISKS